MDIQYNPEAHKLPIIYSEDLEYYSKQLTAMLRAYRKLIFVKTPRQEQALRELEHYAAQLESKNYDAVISNSREIISYADPLQQQSMIPPWDDRYPF